MALLLSACGDGCSEDIMTSQWRFSEGSSENICQQFIDVRLERDISNQFVSIDLELKIWVDSPTRSIAVDHSSEYVKTDSTSGYFELTVGDTLPSDVVRSGSNVLRRLSLNHHRRLLRTPFTVAPILSVTRRGPEMSSSAAPEPAPEPDSDVEQPVSNLKAVFHFAILLTPSAVHLCRSLMSLVSLTMQMSR